MSWEGLGYLQAYIKKFPWGYAPKTGLGKGINNMRQLKSSASLLASMDYRKNPLVALALVLVTPN